MKITKKFVEIYMLDMEGRRGEWMATDKTYEEEVALMDGYRDKVRIVEKTFDDETFKITEKTLRLAEKEYDWGKLTWEGKVKETITEG